MAVIYDALTGLPKQQAQTSTGFPGQVAFLQQPAPGGAPSGATGVGTSAAGAPSATGGGPLSWQDFLANDPFWKQFNADLSAQGIADEGAAKAATQRAIIQFGEVPDNLTGQAANWIDPTTRTLAQQNTAAGTSQLARINKFNQDSLRAIKNALAARGALRSGELGYQLKENQQQYTNAQYDQRTALTDTLSGIQAGLAAAQRAAAMQRAQALGQVVNNFYGQPQPAPAAAPAPTPTGTPPAVSEGNPVAGQPVYSTAYGTPGYRKPLISPFDNPF